MLSKKDQKERTFNMGLPGKHLKSLNRLLLPIVYMAAACTIIPVGRQAARCSFLVPRLLNKSQLKSQGCHLLLVCATPLTLLLTLIMLPCPDRLSWGCHPLLVCVTSLKLLLTLPAVICLAQTAPPL